MCVCVCVCVKLYNLDEYIRVLEFGPVHAIFCTFVLSAHAQKSALLKVVRGYGVG